MRRLALPEGIKRWSLTSVQTRLIKIGGRLVRYAMRLVFELAEVMVTRDMFNEMLERIGMASSRSWLADHQRAWIHDQIEAAQGRVRDL